MQAKNRHILRCFVSYAMSSISSTQTNVQHKLLGPITDGPIGICPRHYNTTWIG